ncbi:glycolate oxidase subunit GlcE [uncultured Piscinibacter sp.]|uniref:glycolate oxidase subunit GlcE n=1 Tax=uncultured Piscinibacter sp. TaxID=1131835 RepID=UPI002632EF88|nr:glycolate oxidase subunit GlcE [uncultured Piscinibacter sp.]
MTNDPALQMLVDRVQSAQSAGAQLCIQGGGTKSFYGEVPQGEVLDTRVLEGISSYEPTELVVTARCGTDLAELEATLAEQGQCLPFEPPHFGADATVGGMVAAGLSGPSRAAVGAVRDYVLGATLLNGRGEVLSFGGQVMKNVAGYDISRLLAGSMGTLGVILEVSLKVLPVAPATATLRFSMDEARAITRLNEWGGQPLPLNASAWWDGTLVVRLRGALAAVQAATDRLGGELIEPAQATPFWNGLRHQHDEFFIKAAAAVEGGARLWRLSVPPTTPPLALPGEQLVEWGGAQRWVCCAAPAALVRDAASRAGGHATLFRARDKSAGAFAPLKSPLDRIHRELKKAFDPSGVFNPGRMYPGL